LVHTKLKAKQENPTINYNKEIAIKFKRTSNIHISI
jgi:hypothetical protein